jgi:hypothetical protein
VLLDVRRRLCAIPFETHQVHCKYIIIILQLHKQISILNSRS